MAKENESDIVETLKDRGITCSTLRKLEKREMKETGDFRRAGFQNIANAQELSAKKIKNLRQQVCKLR